MAMTVFMAMAMGVPCYGHDHAMTAVINMSWQCHGHGHVSQGESHGESHDVGKSWRKGFVVGQRNELGEGQ